MCCVIIIFVAFANTEGGMVRAGSAKCVCQVSFSINASAAAHTTVTALPSCFRVVLSQETFDAAVMLVVLYWTGLQERLTQRNYQLSPKLFVAQVSSASPV